MTFRKDVISIMLPLYKYWYVRVAVRKINQLCLCLRTNNYCY